jgi:hypothetical protein
VPVRADFQALLPPVDPGFTQAGSPPAADVRFLFRNRGPGTYRHPDPIEPTPVVARWYGPSGSVVGEQHLRTLLPIALAVGEEQVRTLHLEVAAPGATYRVTLAREDDATHELATTQVEITPP